MSDDVLRLIFGWTGTGLAMIFYIAPVVPMYKLLNDQVKVKDVTGVLLICSFMNCILWTDYGLLINDFTVYFANGVGGGISLIWITIYLIYLGNKNIKIAALFIFLLMAAIAGISIAFYFFIPTFLTGKVAMIFNILMYAAPGEKLVRVFKTKAYNLIPIYSTFGGLLCSLCWMLFGIIKADINLIVPNALGLFFSVFEIIIYYVFYCIKKNENNFDFDEDDKLA
jgi:solute carrier family 50 protein (sugar transporter)